MSGRTILLLALSLLPSIVVYATMTGLGLFRQGTPAAVALAATTLTFGPALAAGATATTDRAARFAVIQTIWSLALFLIIPVYFPGERRDALGAGLALLHRSERWEDLSQELLDRLPPEPDVSSERIVTATTPAPEATPPPTPLESHEIALPYEGEGRRLSVPVVFEHDGVTVETFMMLDTGATYTTLPYDVLRKLDALPGPNAPELVLNTANGERQAKVVLLDRVWLGDLEVGGVAITTCEDCASEDNAGLLGLNVAGGYNVTIDADRREVVFSGRQTFNRRLDVRPFSELEANFTRYPGGRVEFDLTFANLANREVQGGAAKIRCDDDEWIVALDPVPPREVTQVTRRLPSHPRCDAYRVSLDAAQW